MQYRRLLTFATRIDTRGFAYLKGGPASRNRFFSFTSRTFDESKRSSTRSFDPIASFRITDSPNPKWELGRGLPEDVEPGKSWKVEEEKGWKTWNLLDTAPRYVSSRRTSSGGLLARPVVSVVLSNLTLPQAFLVRNPLTHADREVYPLLTSCIVPRPIALVSTISEDGVPNLAPFR